MRYQNKEPNSGSEFFNGRTRNIKDRSALISMGNERPLVGFQVAQTNTSPGPVSGGHVSLVLALNRLLAVLAPGERPPAASARLDELFRLVQSQPDFEPGKFAHALAVFAQTLGG